MEAKELFPDGLLDITLRRLCLTLLERHPDFANTVLVGLQPRGVFLAKRLLRLLEELQPGVTVPYGELDVTFHRDDVGRRATPLIPAGTRLNAPIEGTTVVLVDDVLYTGRTVRAALDALLAYGRPAHTELLVLVDRRRRRHVPIAPDYAGTAVHTLDEERVVVEWLEAHGRDSVRLEPVTVS